MTEVIVQPDTSRPLPQPERHWCPGCWAEMSAGSAGKCAKCLGEFDDVWAGGMVRQFWDAQRPTPRRCDFVYHGRTVEEA